MCRQLVKHASGCQQLVKLRAQLEPLNVRTCVCSFFVFVLRGALEAWSLFIVCVCARARVVQGVEGCEL